MEQAGGHSRAGRAAEAFSGPMAPPLITPAEARERVLACVRPLELETVALADALGRVLGEPLDSTDDVPPFDSSAMDGFAVRAGHTRGAAAGAPVVASRV